MLVAAAAEARAPLTTDVPALRLRARDALYSYRCPRGALGEQRESSGEAFRESSSRASSASARSPVVPEFLRFIGKDAPVMRNTGFDARFLVAESGSLGWPRRTSNSSACSNDRSCLFDIRGGRACE